LLWKLKRKSEKDGHMMMEERIKRKIDEEIKTTMGLAVTGLRSFKELDREGV
jgi:hypothetical protein